jgi:hypothetical protein
MTIRHECSNTGVRVTRVAVALLLATSLNGCIILPHEERTMRGVEVPPSATAGFVAGQTTRDDVLHLLGRPDRVDGDGRYFCYQWTLSAALWLAVVGGPYSAAVIGGEIPSGSDSVCMEFAPSGELVRWGRLHSNAIIKSYEKTARGWQEQSTASAPAAPQSPPEPK